MTSQNLLIKRLISKKLPELNNKKIVLLTGARQTGKTTLAKSHYDTLKYLNLDSQEIRDSIRKISSFNWGRDVGRAILDEAQKEPSLFDKLKYAYDSDLVDFQVILGSSQILLLKNIRESLAGRVSLYELYPLMLCELFYKGTYPDGLILLNQLLKTDRLSNLLDDVPTVLIGYEDIKLKEIENYLLIWGGMPALLHIQDEEEKRKWIKDYSYTYLERDLLDLSRLNDLDPFKKFQKLSALRTGNLLNYSEIARDAGISVDTAKRYIEYLKISYQAILIQPYFENLTSTVVKTPKIFWLDMGILRYLTGNWGEVINGNVYETFVVSEIYKYIKTMQLDCEIYFYRTKSGMEIDLLLKTSKGMLGIEIKNRNSIVKSDFNNLKKIGEYLGSNWIGGIVLYTGDVIEKLAEPEIWAVPTRRLLV